MPLRVLIANDHLGSAGGMHGVARFMLRFIPKVDSRHVSFVPVILRARDQFAQPFEEKGIDVRFLGRSRADPRALLDFVGIIRDERIDLLHVMGIKCDVIGRIAGLLTGIPVLVHGHDALELRPGYIRVIDRWLGPRTKYSLAVSAHVRDYLSERRSIPKDAIEIVPLGLDLNEYRHVSLIERRVARAQLGVPDGELLIGSLGRLDKIKGLDVLVEAAAIMARKYPNFRLLIAGDGDEAARLEIQIGQRGLDSRVRLIGYQKSARSFLSALDLYVIPSRSEGLPTALMEAMALGLCVVASDVGGIPEIVRDENNGLLVPAENSEVLADTCLRALKDPVLREQLGEAAAVSSRETLSLARTISRVEAFYDEMVG